MKYMKYFSYIIFVLLIFYLSGCSRWSLRATIKNPKLPQVKFNKILVFFNTSDIGTRGELEDILTEKFNFLGIDAISSMKLIPPIAEYSEQEISEILCIPRSRTDYSCRYSEQEISEILDRNKIDGILVVEAESKETSQVYIPKTTSTKSFVEPNITPYSSNIYYQSYTTEKGGYYISEYVLKSKISLIDRKSGKIAWLSIWDTSSTYLGIENLFNYLAIDLARKLKEANLVNYIDKKPIDKKPIDKKPKTNE
jgi:hypothetical protein